MKYPKTIMCAMTGKREPAEFHITKLCRFYAGQPYKPSLGNGPCHDLCTVPKRFEIVPLAKNDGEA